MNVADAFNVAEPWFPHLEDEDIVSQSTVVETQIALSWRLLLLLLLF